jgi:hypothetical protein
MPLLGCIPARIYVSLATTDLTEAHRLLAELAEELDTLDITDADVALFATNDGQIRPDFTQAFGILLDSGEVLPCDGLQPLRTGYTVRVEVHVSPSPQSAETRRLLEDSGLLGTHQYIFPTCANAVEACALAERRIRHEWAAIPDLENAVLIDVVSVVKRTHQETALPPAAPAHPDVVRAD